MAASWTNFLMLTFPLPSSTTCRSCPLLESSGGCGNPPTGGLAAFQNPESVRDVLFHV